MTYALNDMLKS